MGSNGVPPLKFFSVASQAIVLYFNKENFIVILSQRAHSLLIAIYNFILIIKINLFMFQGDTNKKV